MQLDRGGAAREVEGLACNATQFPQREHVLQQGRGGMLVVQTCRQHETTCASAVVWFCKPRQIIWWNTALLHPWGSRQQCIPLAAYLREGSCWLCGGSGSGGGGAGGLCRLQVHAGWRGELQRVLPCCPLPRLADALHGDIVLQLTRNGGGGFSSGGSIHTRGEAGSATLRSAPGTLAGQRGSTGGVGLFHTPGCRALGQ